MMEFVLLKDIVKFIRTGKTPPSKETKYFNGDFNWYTPTDLDRKKNLGISKRTITELAVEDKKVITYPKGTLLVGCIGDIGKIGITTVKSSSNQQITGIYPNDSTDVNYLYYWFRGNKKKLEHFSHSAVVPILNNKNLEVIKIPLPPLPEQRKIAAILDEADKLRQLNKNLITKYDELTQSLFLDMFGDPVTNPLGWEKKAIIENCNCIVPGRDKPKSFTGNTPWVTTNDLVYLGHTYGSVSGIGLTDTEITNVKAKIIPKGSVIMTCVGDLGVVTINSREMVVNQQLHAFQCNEKLNNVFLMYNISYQKPYMKKMASSTTVPYMNKTVSNNTPTILPPIALQNQFAERVEKIESQKAQAQESLVKSEELFGALLQESFGRFGSAQQPNSSN